MRARARAAVAFLGPLLVLADAQSLWRPRSGGQGAVLSRRGRARMGVPSASSAAVGLLNPVFELPYPQITRRAGELPPLPERCASRASLYGTRRLPRRARARVVRCGLVGAQRRSGEGRSVQALLGSAHVHSRRRYRKSRCCRGTGLGRPAVQPSRRRHRCRTSSRRTWTANPLGVGITRPRARTARRQGPWNSAWTNSIALCSAMKSENVTDVREWLLYYQWLGVDHVFLTENSDAPATMEPALADFIAAGFVTFTVEPRAHAQLFVFSECIKRHRGEYNWLAFFDLDEFLTVRERCDTAPVRARWSPICWACPALLRPSQSPPACGEQRRCGS